MYDAIGNAHVNFPALSVQQPWAELIISGRKSIEVRTWWTEYRGPLWIHASLKANPELDHEFGLMNLFRGGFIGRVILTTVVRFDQERWERWRERHLSGGPLPEGGLGFVLKDPLRLRKPLSSPGALKLFMPGSDSLRTLQLSLGQYGNAS
jgi:hypothetical protein